MPRKGNEHVNEQIKKLLASGMTASEAYKALKGKVPMTRINYYAYASRKKKSHVGAAPGTEFISAPVDPAFTNKILRARKILEADFLSEDLRISLARDVLA